MVRLPRVVIAAAASGQGKTTVAVGIMAALARSGRVVGGAKVGPDYIDPGYHALATGRPGRNLDPWLQGEHRILPLLAHGALTPSPAEVTVIEGVMGLFDGRLGADGWASTAHLATLTRSPVVAVLDISSAARTVAATVHGLRTYDGAVHLAGVILNKAGSDRHTGEVRRSVEQLGVPVLGVLPRDAGVSAPSRHLGLVPVAERPEAVTALDRLAEQTSTLIDLDALQEIAAAAPDLDVQPWRPPSRPTGTPRLVAVAGGRAFTFRYAETDEILRALGCEPVIFDPATDTNLPAGTAGIYLGGGFPQVHAATLTSNARLLAEIREAVASGVPTVAECAGLLYLADAVDGHRLVGAVPTSAAMHPRLTLRYRTATVERETLLAEPGSTIHGHEFHRTRTDPRHGSDPAWLLDGDPEGWSLDPAGSGSPTLHASYLHVHWAGHPEVAARFADAVHAFAWSAAPGRRAGLGAAPAAPPQAAPPGDPLEHHGDAETDPSLIDFAVNVQPGPPPWLAQQLREAVADLAGYPKVDAARQAIARRHQVPEQAVLPTSGAAEAFVLIARALHPTHPVIVHPQFTEPEAALRRAGHRPGHVYCGRDFTLDPAAVPDDADLVVIGNPTNPTGVVHPVTTLQALRRPGRILVVDEAFLDCVTVTVDDRVATDASPAAGEPDSLIGRDLDAVLVLRSLTKTWGVAGLRAGYVVGDPTLLTELARQQPHWSVNSLAALVMQATATTAAVAQARTAARQLAGWRTHLTRGLTRLGLRPVASQASFVLVEAGVGVRERLRGRGYAVRRGDTFPGLGPSWVRIAVRDPHTTDGLLRELAAVLDSRECSA